MPLIRFHHRPAKRLTFLWFLLASTLPALSQPPLVNAHAHNDYEHKRPLFDALAQGFCSVEADIHLVDGQLLVAHDSKETKKDRTLQSLYLDPLRKLVRKHGGHVYPTPSSFWLLIDVKSEAGPAYAVLRDLLEQYADMLTVFREDRVERKAVTVVISGDRDQATMKSEKVRYAGIDGRLEDLDSGLSAAVFPWISANWIDTFQWSGVGEFPPAQRQKLREIVDKAHRHGYLVRFWATPHSESLWRIEREAGVDLLNADDLPRLRRFLLSQLR